MSIDAAKIGINGIVRISMRKHCPNWGKEWGERGASNKKRRLIFDCCLNITSSRCTIELQKQALLMMASCAVKPLLAGSTLILGYMHFCAKCHLLVTTTWSASSWCSIGLLAGEKKMQKWGHQHFKLISSHFFLQKCFSNFALITKKYRKKKRRQRQSTAKE